MRTLPSGTESDPYLIALVASSLTARASERPIFGLITRAGPSTLICSIGKGARAFLMISAIEALCQRAALRMSCALPRALRRLFSEARADSISVLRSVCEAMAASIARMFLMRCSSSWVRIR